MMEFLITVAGLIILILSLSFYQTHRKLSQNIEQICKEKRHLDLGMAFANKGLWEWDIISGTFDYDQRSFSKSGYEISGFPGSFSELLEKVHPDDTKELQLRLDEHFSGQSPFYEVEFRFMNKEGQWDWVKSQGAVVSHDDTGKPTRMVGTLTNITKKKQIDQQLRDSERKYRKLYEGSIDGFVRINLEGTVLESNKAYKEMLGGYTDDELAKLTYQEFTPLKWAEIEMGIVRDQVMVNGYSGYYEKEYIKKDGTVFPVALRVHLIKDQQGVPTGMWAFVSDITKRKKAEEELRQARNYISNIINSMPSVLVGVDLEGMITQWNIEAERATGVSKEDAVGRDLETSFPRIAEELAQVHKAIKTRSVQTETKKVRQEDHETVYEDITVYPLVTNGAEGAVIRIDDVTDQVRLEEMMIQSEKMLSVGGLAAGMAHEINNPLAGMLQTANVLRNRLTDMSVTANRRAAEEVGISLEDINAFMKKREVDRLLSSIDKSGKRTAEIIRNMLSFARKGDSVKLSCDLADLLERTIELAAADYDLKNQYDFRKIEIIRDYQPNLPLVFCEGAKIQQVILNILKNGAQAMQETQASRDPRFDLRLSYHQQSDRITLEFEDNGPGISNEIRKRVFEPFFTTKPVGIGTGLGLSVSYFIVTENHKGQMSVISKPGHGTNFVIHLPRQGK